MGVASRMIAINEAAFLGERAPERKAQMHFPEHYESGFAVLIGNAAKMKEPHAPDSDKIDYID